MKKNITSNLVFLTVCCLLMIAFYLCNTLIVTAEIPMDNVHPPCWEREVGWTYPVPDKVYPEVDSVRYMEFYEIDGSYTK